MMSLWDALRMNMMISYQELVRTFPKTAVNRKWTCLSALFDLISYISIAYLIDFVVNNYN
ncbi:hypothetical protein, partial [Klebsiella pneumoniae]